MVVGAVLIQRYQRRNAQFARLHEDRIDAYSKFIDAVVEYRRAHLERALRERADQLGVTHDNIGGVLSAASSMIEDARLSLGGPSSLATSVD